MDAELTTEEGGGKMETRIKSRLNVERSPRFEDPGLVGSIYRVLICQCPQRTFGRTVTGDVVADGNPLSTAGLERPMDAYHGVFDAAGAALGIFSDLEPRLVTDFPAS